MPAPAATARQSRQAAKGRISFTASTVNRHVVAAPRFAAAAAIYAAASAGVLGRIDRHRRRLVGALQQFVERNRAGGLAEHEQRFDARASRRLPYDIDERRHCQHEARAGIVQLLRQFVGAVPRVGGGDHAAGQRNAVERHRVLRQVSGSSTVTLLGPGVIPADVRADLKIDTGIRVEFVERDGVQWHAIPRRPCRSSIPP